MSLVKSSVRLLISGKTGFSRVFCQRHATKRDLVSPTSNVFTSNYSSVPPLWKHNGDTGPEHWHKWYPEAKGNRQSPIPLSSNSPINNYSMNITGYQRKQVLSAENLGHIISYTGENTGIGSGSPCYITGVHDWTEKYSFNHMHMHWAKTSECGSEHSIDDRFFPMELHVVHCLANLSLAEACNRAKGIAVLGFMYEISDEDNESYAPLIEANKAVVYKGQKTSFSSSDPLSLIDLLPKDFDAGHFWYKGSLTTPPCSEVVHWMVFSKAIPISEKQMESFRALQRCEGARCFEPMSDNYRPLQPINDRPVYKSFDFNLID